MVVCPIRSDQISMSDSKQSDHWDLLASTLGAEPQKRELGESIQAEEKIPDVADEVEEKTDSRNFVAQPPSEPAVAHPVRSLSNWDALAMELGIEVKPEPPPPPVPAQMPVAKPVEKKSVVPAEKLREPVRPAAAEFGKDLMPFGISETLPAEDSEEPNEKKSRHRRRRHRKGRDKDRPAAEIKKQHSDAIRESPASDDFMPSEIPAEMADRPGVEDEEDRDEVEAGERRLKHRRSRRGSHKQKNEGAESVRDKTSDMKKGGPAEHTESVAATELNEICDKDEITDEEQDDEGQRSAKSGFRAIPTWEEAVGFIVAKNMELHPKRQGNAPSRSRSAANSHKRQRK